MTKQPIDLGSTPVHIGTAQQPATPLPEFGFDQASFETYIEQYCSDDPGRLIMVETTPSNWASWERHPAGDEIVIVLEGSGQFIQEVDGTEIRIDVVAGDTIVNPKGVWHTADVTDPIKAIYITPCPGTEHRSR